MTEEVKKYAEKRILESNIRTVPGHYPVFESEEQVDMFLKMSELSFKACENESIKIADLTKVDRNEYQSLLKRLKKNKENVPLETLKTKYRKKYLEINTAIRESGIMKKASHAAFIQQDADLVLEYAG